MTARNALALLALLALPAPARAQVAKANFLADGSFALPTAGPGAMERPRALAWAPGNQIHVADERGTVSVFTATGTFVRAYGAPTVKKVAGLAVDRAGRAYVLDPEQKIVFVFDTAGQVVRRIGTPGSDAGQLQEPLDVAIGPTGLVYVLDKGRKGVQLFSLDGTFVHDVRLPIEAKDPRALAVAPSGRVYVADKERPGALVRLPALTVALATVDAPPPEVDVVTVRGARLDDPISVVATGTGSVAVADRDSGVLWLVDGAGGAPVGADDKLYGGEGSGRGSFRRLEDIAVGGSDEVVALDSEGRKVERIKLVLEAGRAAEAALDYPVQFESFAPTVDPGVLAAAPRASGTAWIALADAEGRNLRVVEARMVDKVGVFGGRVRVPEVAAGAQVHAFGTVIEQAGFAALNDTLLVVSEPRRNRFHVFDLRTDAHVGAFGDGYSDGRRLRNPRGVALYADGRVAVADHGNDRVAVFSADVATLLGTFPLPKAQGVAVAPDGRLYAWDEEGLTIGRLPTSGTSFEALPAGLSTGGVSALAVDGAGNLYALRRGTSRVAVLAAGSDRLIARVGGHRGIERGDRLAVDPDGNIYATDSEKGTTVVARWGGGSAPGPGAHRELVRGCGRPRVGRGPGLVRDGLPDRGRRRGRRPVGAGDRPDRNERARAGRGGALLQGRDARAHRRRRPSVAPSGGPPSGRARRVWGPCLGPRPCARHRGARPGSGGRRARRRVGAARAPLGGLRVRERAGRRPRRARLEPTARRHDPRGRRLRARAPHGGQQPAAR